jgi:hypothetical protein
MKLIVLFLVLLSFASCTILGELAYKHKSEAELEQMTPAQRVDEIAKEQAYHKYNLDDQSQLINKYIERDGLKALPRLIEIIDEYDPTRTSGKSGSKGEYFDAAWMTMSSLDSRVIRLRASDEGKHAIEALERAIGRMRAAGHGQPGQHEWAEHGRFDLALMTLEELKGNNSTDETVKDTFWVKYKIQMSNQELLQFSNFLVTRDAMYPSWSGTDFIKDYTRINEAGNPLQVYIMKKPEQYHEAYLEFKKTTP